MVSSTARGWAAVVILASLAGWASSASGPLSARQRPTFRSGVDIVHFGLTVTDKKGKLVTDLKVSDLEVYEDGRKQELQFFVPGHAGDDGSAGARPPLHLGTLFDASGSMDEDLRFARSAAIKFLNRLRDAEDYTLVDFDTEVRIARFSQAEFPRLVERLRTRKADGYTALWDAIGVHLDGASFQDGRKILVLYTDGADNSSNITFDDLFQLLKASDVTVHAVGFFRNQASAPRVEQAMRLKQLAEVTGGQAFFPGSMKDLDEAYDKLAEEIDAQYTVGYLSSNARADGTWRKVEIRITRPDLKEAKIRSRTGYYAPLKERAPGK